MHRSSLSPIQLPKSMPNGAPGLGSGMGASFSQPRHPPTATQSQQQQEVLIPSNTATIVADNEGLIQSVDSLFQLHMNHDQSSSYESEDEIARRHLSAVAQVSKNILSLLDNIDSQLLTAETEVKEHAVTFLVLKQVLFKFDFLALLRPLGRLHGIESAPLVVRDVDNRWSSLMRTMLLEPQHWDFDGNFAETLLMLLWNHRRDAFLTFINNNQQAMITSGAASAPYTTTVQPQQDTSMRPGAGKTIGRQSVHTAVSVHQEQLLQPQVTNTDVGNDVDRMDVDSAQTAVIAAAVSVATPDQTPLVAKASASFSNPEIADAGTASKRVKRKRDAETLENPDPSDEKAVTSSEAMDPPASKKSKSTPTDDMDVDKSVKVVDPSMPPVVAPPVQKQQNQQPKGRQEKQESKVHQLQRLTEKPKQREKEKKSKKNKTKSAATAVDTGDALKKKATEPVPGADRQQGKKGGKSAANNRFWFLDDIAKWNLAGGFAVFCAMLLNASPKPIFTKDMMLQLYLVFLQSELSEPKRAPNTNLQYDASWPQHPSVTNVAVDLRRCFAKNTDKYNEFMVTDSSALKTIIVRIETACSGYYMPLLKKFYKERNMEYAFRTEEECCKSWPSKLAPTWASLWVSFEVLNPGGLLLGLKFPSADTAKHGYPDSAQVCLVDGNNKSVDQSIAATNIAVLLRGPELKKEPVWRFLNARSGVMESLGQAPWCSEYDSTKKMRQIVGIYEQEEEKEEQPQKKSHGGKKSGAGKKGSSSKTPANEKAEIETSTPPKPKAKSAASALTAAAAAAKKSSEQAGPTRQRTGGRAETPQSNKKNASKNTKKQQESEEEEESEVEEESSAEQEAERQEEDANEDARQPETEEGGDDCDEESESDEEENNKDVEQEVNENEDEDNEEDEESEDEEFEANDSSSDSDVSDD